MKPVIPFREKFKKNIAIDLRKKGLSYTDIQKQLFVPRSTLSHWLKDVELTDAQKEKLNDRRTETLRKNSARRKTWTQEEIERIKNASAKDIKDITKRELWLMGIILYWRERFSSQNSSDLRNGVRLTTSDPFIARLFIRWLRDIGNIQDKEIDFDFFISEDQKESLNKIINYWAAATDFSKKHFNRYYVQKISKSHSKLKSRKRSHFGFLRIRVKASSQLARQISGWIKGMQDFLSESQ